MSRLLRKLTHRQLAEQEKRHLTKEDMHNVVIEGALLRLRPIMMTVFAIIGGLLPIMLLGGTGSEVMRRIAAPMIGGVVSVTLLSLVVIPAVYLLWKQWNIHNLEKDGKSINNPTGTKSVVI
ncbi:MAG: hypothetical protein BGO67_12495 [Alphaproteobacteria bacterium 41-28]|nr:MAG: hypothetical protein BGO67_12495 [Alphaproteobacteria bacterium 41-28]